MFLTVTSNRRKIYFESIPDEKEDPPLDLASNSPSGSSRGSFFKKLSTSFRLRKDDVDYETGKKGSKSAVALIDEDDPVMNHFRSKRVRFAMDSVPSPTPPVKSSPRHRAMSPTRQSAIHRFIKGALFGKTDQAQEYYHQEASKEVQAVQKELAASGAAALNNSQDRHSSSDSSSGGAADDDPEEAFPHPSVWNYEKDAPTIARVTKLLNKARRALHMHHRYSYAVKCHVRALDLVREFPQNHPVLKKTVEGLQTAQQMLSSYETSANIVKMGIKCEDTGDLIRALKMYTIAYRIRRDHLSKKHPSLVVLLNMLGSIQIKRNELDEARQILELALSSEFVTTEDLPKGSLLLLTKSVTYRELGAIDEQKGNHDAALKFYHRSLQCIANYKGLDSYKCPWASSQEKEEDPVTTREVTPGRKAKDEKEDPESPQIEAKTSNPEEVAKEDILADLEMVRVARTFVNRTEVVHADKATPGREDGEDGNMELLYGLQKKSGKTRSIVGFCREYEFFFPPSLDDQIRRKGFLNDADTASVDAALTLHRIAQMHRKKGEYNLALATFDVALRGMKYSLGKYHRNVAAVLGNIGNLRKEMGDMDIAFETYQQVLAIESYRLGLSHPDVTVTLHNIATIDASRGNHEHALALYKQVLALQSKLFGDDDEAVAVTRACMGDVYERLGDTENATDCFEEALRIKMITTGRHSLEAARLFHKLGKLSLARNDFQLAEICVSKAILIYRLNHLPEDSVWMVDANRDAADIDAAVQLGRMTTQFEC